VTKSIDLFHLLLFSRPY